MRLLIAVLLLLLPAVAGATEIQRVKSPGGIEAWLVREPKIPMIALEAVWRGGAASDPRGKEGRAQMVASLLDEGAGELDSQAFHARLEASAINLGFSADRDFFRGTLRTLSDKRDEAFRLLGLAVSQPRFDAEPVERVRRQKLVQIARSSTDPESMASRAWYAAAFPDHAYGRAAEGTPESIGSLAAPDFAAFVRERLARDNLVIGVVGDIDAAELGRLLDLAFAGLPAQSVKPQLPVERAETRAEPLVAPLDVPQSAVRFGGPGVGRKHPDYYPAFILNYVLGGGGFSSRLIEEVREKRGLAYSVFTTLAPLEAAPIQIGGVGTRNETVAEVIRLVRAEFARLQAEGLTEAELANAKAYITGSFPLRLTSNAAIAGMLASIQVYDLGIDFIDRYPGYIEAVTLADVNRVARERFDPAKLLFVVAGQPVGLGG